MEPTMITMVKWINNKSGMDLEGHAGTMDKFKKDVMSMENLMDMDELYLKKGIITLESGKILSNMVLGNMSREMGQWKKDSGQMAILLILMSGKPDNTKYSFR